MTNQASTTAAGREALAPFSQERTGEEREVRRALRSTLLKYQLHREQELFDRAYDYIRQYY
jgi:type I restriction enzyme R subunit